jgi:DNA mismatch repair ATPase MutS
VSTHDLTLADAPELSDAAQQVHFTERIEPGEGAASMTFDYRLRGGPATSTNALRLLESMGLLDG